MKALAVPGSARESISKLTASLQGGGQVLAYQDNGCRSAPSKGSRERRSPERVTREARRAWRVLLIYPRCTRALRDPATRNADLQAVHASPLTDSNRRPSYL
jgi:hypothetical protein